MYGERLPEIPYTENLPDYWRDMGFAMLAPEVGFLPFTWQEVAAFKYAGGYDISPTEARVLIDMSRAYASNHADTNPLSIEPMERMDD